MCMSKLQTSLLLLSGVVWSRPVLTSSTMCLTASSVTGWASFLSLCGKQTSDQGVRVIS